MVTRPRKAKARRSPPALPRLYVAEHMAAKEVGDKEVAKALGVARETVTRWRGGRHPDREYIAPLEAYFGCGPGGLRSPPAKKPRRVSIDAVLEGADDETHEIVLKLAEKVLKTGT